MPMDGKSDDLMRTGAGLDVLAEVIGPQRDPLLGRVLGDYTIVELIAEGGMSRVYLGIRTDGTFERRVAIKVSPLSNLSDTLREGFTREQSTLASLNHPNITQLYDARLAEDGLPYIVMELIDGTSIDDYCSNPGMQHTEIVELLVNIVDAIAYAHARLIVHRDIKPSNVLVDTDGQPKLLDFGIAKLLNAEDGALTRAAPLTPQYASPEQLMGGPITTASDIYQVGLLAYELLVGHPLIPAQNLSQAVQRAADQRPISLDPVVRKALPSELLLIIEHCLRPAPDERYPAANALKADLQAYLRGYPISAAGQRSSYRLRKFIQRNVAAVSITVIAVTGMAGGATWYTWQLNAARTTAEQEAATATQISSFLTALLSASMPETKAAGSITVRELLDQGATEIFSGLEEQPEVKVQLLITMSKAYLSLVVADEAERLIEEALAIQRTLDDEALIMADALNQKGLGQIERTDYDASKATLEAALAIAMKHTTLAARVIQGEIHLNMGSVYYELGQSGRAIEFYEKAHEMLVSGSGINHPSVLPAMSNLASAKFDARDYQGAVDGSLRVLELAEELHGAQHASMPAALNNLSRAYQQMGRFDDAEAAAIRALGLAQVIYGKEHPEVAWIMGTLAVANGANGHQADAIDNLEGALALMTSAYGADHKYTTGMRETLSFFYIKAARYEEAAQQLLLSERSMTEQLPAISHAFADHWFNWGGLYKLTEEYELSIENFQKSQHIYTELYGADDRWTADALLEIAEVRRLMGDFKTSADFYDRGLAILLRLWEDNHPAVMKYSTSYLAVLETLGADAEAAIVRERIARAEAASG